MIWDPKISFEGFFDQCREWYKGKDFELCDPPISAKFALDLIFKTLIDDKEHYPYLTTMPECAEQTNSIMLDIILSKYSWQYRRAKKRSKNVEERRNKMIKFENTEVVGWEAAIRGMRNPLNSWDKSDSCWGCTNNPEDDSRCDACDNEMCAGGATYRIGPNDKDLMRRLRNAGTDHRKFMRMITVYVDITAPLYWWKEFDTYKVGTVANSCSTMHKIASKEFTLEDFSTEHLFDRYGDPSMNLNYGGKHPIGIMNDLIRTLNHFRHYYLKTKDKKYWWQMIQLLPSSYNQRRTVMLNYEVLANMYKSRKNHKLDEWRGFCEWIKTMPYHELITGFELTTETKKLLDDMVEDIDEGKVTMNEARARMGFPPIDMSAFPKHTMGMGPIPADLAHDIGIAPQPSNTINLGPHEKAIVDQIVNDIAKGMGKINLDKYYGGNEE